MVDFSEVRLYDVVGNALVCSACPVTECLLLGREESSSTHRSPSNRAHGGKHTGAGCSIIRGEYEASRLEGANPVSALQHYLIEPIRWAVTARASVRTGNMPRSRDAFAGKRVTHACPLLEPTGVAAHALVPTGPQDAESHTARGAARSRVVKDYLVAGGELL